IFLVLYRQCIKICSECDCRKGRINHQPAEDAAPADTLLYINTQFPEILGDVGGCLNFLEGKFRIHMEIAPESHHFVIAVLSQLFNDGCFHSITCSISSIFINMDKPFNIASSSRSNLGWWWTKSLNLS